MANATAQRKINEQAQEIKQLQAALAQAANNRSMITPPEVVSALTLHRTIGENIEFGRCNHALQLLPNNAVLLLVTEEKADGGADRVSTFFGGEEACGFTVTKTMIETADDKIIA